MITGGFGGLGQLVAQWLIGQGARNLILIGRSAPSNDVQERINQYEAQGVACKTIVDDISDPIAVTSIFASITATLPPLKGIIHAAGMIHDGAISQLDRQRFIEVLAPKVEESWNLHENSKVLNLDFFVMFSSISSLIGTSGQGNYAAANMFMDSLAHYRHALGLPAISINWGAWDQVGMAAKLSGAVRRQRGLRGSLSIDPDMGMEVFAQVLTMGIPQMAVYNVRWSDYFNNLPVKKDFPFYDIVRAGREPKPAALKSEKSHRKNSSTDLLSQCADASSDTHPVIVRNFLKDWVKRLLGIPSEQLQDTSASLVELGLDSLTAIELKNRLDKALKRSLPPAIIFEHNTIESLTGFLLPLIDEQLARTKIKSLTSVAIHSSDEGYQSICL
jgi:NAD(P)-dependent dehydrogenase (short-subunit alcohol dehydrogenase family)/acyl carrier protein